MFNKAVELILSFEGGYVNHPKDRGGETNFGISKAQYPEIDILNLTRDQAKEIYKQKYWNPIQGDKLPQGLDLILFDAAVNHGVYKASCLLQKALGVKPDGIIGPATVLSLQGAPIDSLIQSIAIARLTEYQADKEDWENFGKGWSRRLLLVSMISAFYSKSHL